jgi:hypothetical protein
MIGVVSHVAATKVGAPPAGWREIEAVVYVAAAVDCCQMSSAEGAEEAAAATADAKRKQNLKRARGLGKGAIVITK